MSAWEGNAHKAEGVWLARRPVVSLTPTAGPLPHMDVVVLDQNIDLDETTHVLGSDLAEQLHQQAFRGVTCIQTGSSREVGLAALEHASHHALTSLTPITR